MWLTLHARARKFINQVKGTRIAPDEVDQVEVLNFEKQIEREAAEQRLADQKRKAEEERLQAVKAETQRSAEELRKAEEQNMEAVRMLKAQQNTRLAAVKEEA